MRGENSPFADVAIIFLKDGCVPVIESGKVRLAYEEYGTGEPVLLLPPAATPARVWALHQVPAIVEAGYRAITLDARGTQASPPSSPFRLPDLIVDASLLIAELGFAPCLVVGASLGAMIGQELALANPGLVRAAVLLGTRSRTDYFRGKLTRAMAAQARSGNPPSELDALLLLSQLFSAATLADEKAAADLLTLFRGFYSAGVGPAMQYEATIIPDRTAALRHVTRPCMVIAFAEDSFTPPEACREVAAAVPGCRYAEISGCGHFGFLERPEQVNATLIDFFSAVP